MDIRPRVAVRRQHYCTVLIAILFLCLFAAGPLAAQAPAPTSASPKTAYAEKPSLLSSSAHDLTAEDVGAFFDGVVPLQLQREDIAGAVVLVVKDGKVLFTRGYGYSDVAKRTPVSPDGTHFRPGSISKLFTWTAVMQLVEEGKINLDADVNQYLDFKINEKFGKPITMRNILTHTSGFEETIDRLFIADAKDLVSLGDYVKAHQPERIFPPGTTPAYSNYATSLAGYIVERVSGQPFNDYVDQHIFAPLGMVRSTFRQPLPDALKPMMSNGYSVASKPPKRYEVVQAWPAGSTALTAVDISRFMLAHLQDGQYQGAQILKPETARLMHTRAYENHPALSAMALGFYEENSNGHHIIGHGGDTNYFHSDLHLMLDSGVGFFVSYNSAGKGENSPRTYLWRAFLDRYFPYQNAAGQKPASYGEDIKSIEGRYLLSRRLETNFMRIFSVATDASIYSNSDGTISISMFKDLNGQPKRYEEISPLVFREVHGQSLLAFKRGSDGALVAAIDYPFMVFTKAHGSDNNLLVYVVGGFSLTVIVLTLLFWPVGALVRRHYGKRLELHARFASLRLATRLTCVAQVLLLVSFGVIIARISDDLGSISGLYWVVRLGQVCGVLGILGSNVAVYYAGRSWSETARGFWSRIGDSLTALACVSFSWLAVVFHLLKWSLRY
jgi:CubicO group peptidase (beta-lactamase class C family)